MKICSKCNTLMDFKENESDQYETDDRGLPIVKITPSASRGGYPLGKYVCPNCGKWEYSFKK